MEFSAAGDDEPIGRRDESRAVPRPAGGVPRSGAGRLIVQSRRPGPEAHGPRKVLWCWRGPSALGQAGASALPAGALGPGVWQGLLDTMIRPKLTWGPYCASIGPMLASPARVVKQSGSSSSKPVLIPIGGPTAGQEPGSRAEDRISVLGRVKGDEMSVSRSRPGI